MDSVRCKIACVISRGGMREPSTVSESGSEMGLTNEELAVALLSPSALYSQQRLRMGAAMLAAEGNRPEFIAILAIRERCDTVVRHIASCGHDRHHPERGWESQTMDQAACGAFSMNASQDNPTEVLLALDRELDHEVSLVLYGRAA